VWIEIGVWTDLDVGAGGRAGHCSVLDSNRILWIFGGLQDFNLFDVWSFNMTNNQYRLVFNASNSERSFGIQGVPSSDVRPGPLEWPACTIDSKDTIYIYNSYYFWSFNTTSWQFTWIYGNESTSVPEDGVFPGRTYGACLEADSEDNLWLLGASSDLSEAPSVWKRNTSGVWAREYSPAESAIPTTIDGANSVFGSRQLHSCTIDASDKIWIFGGNGPSSMDATNDFAPLWNDLWTFDTKNTQAPWRVEYGFASSYNNNGTLVEPFKYHDTNVPASRHYASNLVDRMDGTILLYGGYGFYEGTASAKQDMWLFNMTTREWALAYGGIELDDLAITKTRLEAEGNYAGSRFYHAIAGGTRNLRGDMIFYGGQTGEFSYYKDVWIVPQNQCALGLDNCSDNADCADTLLGFDCTCKGGYSGDGVTCSEIPVPVQSPVAGSTPQKGPIGKTSAGSALKATLLLIVLHSVITLF
jgi:hypothetical protein